MICTYLVAYIPIYCSTTYFDHLDLSLDICKCIFDLDLNIFFSHHFQTFFKPPWFNEVDAEFLAARSRVAVCDYSSFAKFDLWSSGPEVVDFLQKLCSNDIDMPIGHIRHTGN